MRLTLSAGDRIRVGNDITLTVLAVENGQVQFGLQREKSILPVKPFPQKYEGPSPDSRTPIPGDDGRGW
jgi:hypothetical protein